MQNSLTSHSPSAISQMLRRSSPQETKPLLTGIGGPNNVNPCSSPLMLPLTTPFSVSQASSNTGVGHYAQSNALLSQYGSLFPYTYGQTTAGLIMTSSSNEDTGSPAGNQRSQLPVGSPYQYMYPGLNSGISSYYSQNDSQNGMINNGGSKHQGLLSVFGHLPLPNLNFPPQNYNNQFSPFMNLQYMPPTKSSLTDNNTITNNNNYNNYQFPFTKQNSFLSSAGTTQIYPPGPGNPVAPSPLMMNESVNGNDNDLGIHPCQQLNSHATSRRGSVSSPSSQHGGATIPTTPVSGMEGLQGGWNLQ